MSTEANKENVEAAPVKEPTVEKLMQPPVEEDKEEELVSWIGKKQGTKDLQKNFERFRKQKIDQTKFKKQCATTEDGVDRKDPIFKQRLREKFLDTVKKYFGVPYARRYHQPGEKLYDSPIYLDCCALVRQACRDLKEDFGFVMDRWNQCYQFDTLPIDLEFEEMKPGDLIFYSATYYNPKSKKQKHDMVHVEVFTGGETGEQSIGARW